MYKKDHSSERGTPDTYSVSYQETGECTAVLGTMTNALQAQKALAKAAIHASVIKVSSSQSTRGCAYGITYTCAQAENVRMVLARSGIAVKKYMGG